MATFRCSTPVPIAVSGAGGVTRVYTLPLSLPSDVSSFVVKAASRSFNTNDGADSSVDVAACASDGSGLGWVTGGAPSFGFASGTIPGDGSFGTIGTLPKQTGSDGISIVLFTLPNQPFAYANGVGFGQFIDGTTTLNPVPGGMGAYSQPLYWWNLEYNTSKRRLVVLGDSISLGYNDMWVRSAWQLIARAKDYAVNVQGIASYGSLAHYADNVTYPYLWDRISDILAGSDAVIQLGTNDLGADDLAAMKANLQTIVARLKSYGAKRIYAWTVPPQATYSAEATRTGYNAFLKANYVSLGLAGVYDAAAPVSEGGIASNSDPTVVDVAMDSGDGTHPGAAGQAQIQAGWELAIRPPVLTSASAPSRWRVVTRFDSTAAAPLDVASYSVRRADGGPASPSVESVFLATPNDPYTVVLVLDSPLLDGIIYSVTSDVVTVAAAYYPPPTPDTTKPQDDPAAQVFGVDLDWIDGDPDASGDCPQRRGLDCLDHDTLQIAFLEPGELVHLPDAGVAIGRLVNSTSTQAELDEAAGKLEAQYRRDPRIDNASVEVDATDDGNVKLNRFIKPVALDDTFDLDG